jgi:hypothetical protein
LPSIVLPLLNLLTVDIKDYFEGMERRKIRELSEDL